MIKDKPLKLKVAEALQDDVHKGIARIDAEIMRDLGIRRGDVILIKGNRETVAIADRAYPADVGEGIIRIDGILRKNAKTGIGENVAVSKAEVKEAKKITIAPAQKGIMVQIQGDPKNLVRGLFGRAVVKGDVVVLGGVQRRMDLLSDDFGDINDVFGGMLDNFGFGNLGGKISQMRFVVANVNPNQPVIVTENTEVILNPKAVDISDDELSGITYEDIGGLSEEVKKIREMVEIPLKKPEIFQKLGIEAPKGVLLHGPPGTGKTLLAKAVANESEANFILLNGPEVMSKFYGESEKKIRDVFEEAEKNAPSIIFIDEIDSIAPKREDVSGEVERRVVSQILTMMDGLKGRGKVVVIGATNRVNALDPALRRPGRFDREVAINVPDKEGRLAILKIHTRGMPLRGVDLIKIASITHGFVGADLESLTKEAAMNVLRKVLPDIKLDEEEQIEPKILERLIVTHDDFMDALKIVRPSAMREVLVETPNISWNEVGGLDRVRQELQEAVEWPLKYPESFTRVGIRPSRGILLYGPPGVGKTLLAKAVAKESEANFIQVKGPSLLCISKDTPIISTLCGVEKIENFYKLLREDSIIEAKDDIEYIIPKKEVFIQALKNKKMDFSKVVRAYKLNVKDAYEVTFKDKNTIEVSGNQPFLTLNNEIGWTKTRDLKEGDLVAYPGKMKLFNEKREIKIPENKNLKFIKEDKDFNFVKIFSSIHETKLPKFMNEDLAEFLGWFVSEGGISKEKGSVKIFNINKENKKRIKELFELFVSKDRIKEFDKGIAVYSAPLIYYLEELFGKKLGGKKSYSINVPKIMFFENEKNISAFLRGAWKGDGHIGNLRAEYGSMSEKLAQGISYLLTFLGIRYRLWNRKDNMFMVTINGKEDLIKLDNLIFNKNNEIKVKQHYNAHLILPKIANVLRRLKERNKLKFSKIKSGEKYLPEGLFEAIVSGRKETGVHRLRHIISILEEKLPEDEKNSDEFKLLKFLVESDLLWMRIEKIEKTKEQIMYDIETEEGSFVGGKRPLLLHNSMWVGESEKGIRKIFERARQVAPCVIFFDEIDSLAGRRGAESGTKVTERVLNQLLAEMDGLEDLNDILIIAATNRPDMLDPAILRPGRFDRILLVNAPEEKGREMILEIHSKKMPLGTGKRLLTKIERENLLKDIAKKTSGYTGADIGALVREAGMLALRENIESKQVTKKHFEDALKRVKPSVNQPTIEVYKKIEDNFLKSAKAAVPTENSYFG